MTTLASRLFGPSVSSGARLPIVTRHSRTPRPRREGFETVTLAAGCYWGVDHVYRLRYDDGKDNIHRPEVGFIGGHTKDPTYESVCTGTTGHAEAFSMEFDPKKITYEELIEVFYRMHDPTTLNAQGRDFGTQYRSAIFPHNEQQEKIAREITQKANEQWYKGRIVTEIVPLPWEAFEPAKEDHQAYLFLNPHGYKCPSHKMRNEFPPLQ